MKPTHSQKTLIASFVVDGEPVSKSRARFTKRGSKTVAYTPEKTKAGEERVAWAYRAASRVVASDPEIAYRVEARFFNGTRQRRDVDNMVKLVLDGLNGVAWVDDDQVLEIEARKAYVPKEDARTEVWVYEIGRTEPPKAPCIRCGKEFRTYNSWKSNPNGKKYCSPDCCYTHRVEKRERTCQHCGVSYVGGETSRFCSKNCHDESRRADYVCTECGVTFRHEKNLGPRRKTMWCSDKCREVTRERDARQCKRGHLRAEHEGTKANGKKYCLECNRLSVAASVAAKKARRQERASAVELTIEHLGEA